MEELAHVLRSFRLRQVGSAQDHAPFGIGVASPQAAHGAAVADAGGLVVERGPGGRTRSDPKGAELRIGQARGEKHGGPAASAMLEAATPRAAMAATRGVPMGPGADSSFTPRGHSSRITGSSALQAHGESWEEDEDGEEEHRGERSPLRPGRRRGLLPASSQRSDTTPRPGTRASVPESSRRLNPAGPGTSLSFREDEALLSSSRIGLPSAARPSSAGGALPALSGAKLLRGEERSPLLRGGTSLSGAQPAAEEGAREARQGEQACAEGHVLRKGGGVGSSPELQETGPVPRVSRGSSAPRDIDVSPSESDRAPALSLDAWSSPPKAMGAGHPHLPPLLLRLAPNRPVGASRWPGLGRLPDTGPSLEAHSGLHIGGRAAARRVSLPVASLTHRREEISGRVGAEEIEAGEGSRGAQGRAGDAAAVLQKAGVQRTSLSRNAVAGGLAGAIVSICIHPIDTVKTLIQSQRGSSSRSVGPLVSRLLAERGPEALYKGIAANLATSAPISAVYTSTYEAVKESLLPRLPRVHLGPCGPLRRGGVATSAIFTPSEAKQRMQISTQYSNSLAALVGMARTEGVLPLYDGLGAVLARNIPNSIIKFLVYETLKKNVLEWQAQQARKRDRRPARPPDLTTSAPRARGGRGLPATTSDVPHHLAPALTPLNQLLVGGAAGSTAAFFTTPFDVIKTRMQTQIPGQLPYSSVADAFFRIVQEEGIPGLYRGVVPRLLIYLSQGALFFASYEVLRRTLLAPRPRPATPQLPRTHYGAPRAAQESTGLVG